jgi:Recombinase
VPTGVAQRIAAQHHAGRSLGQIARGLNANRVPTGQGGAKWWASTVRVVLKRVETHR